TWPPRIIKSNMASSQYASACRQTKKIPRAIIVPAAALLQGGCDGQSRASIICRLFLGRTRDVVPRCEADLIACDALIARIAVDDSVVRAPQTRSKLVIAINREMFCQCRCTR
ncbi:MAG: hypothetical protein WB999_08270, partial [Candidatus Binataceae bacterium]